MEKGVVSARGPEDGLDIKIISAIVSGVLKTTMSIPNMH